MKWFSLPKWHKRWLCTWWGASFIFLTALSPLGFIKVMLSSYHLRNGYIRLQAETFEQLLASRRENLSEGPSNLEELFDKQLLSDELETIDYLCKYLPPSLCKSIKTRSAYLANNKLDFVGSTNAQKLNIVERELTQVRPVEVDGNDLEWICTFVEQISDRKKMLYIKDLSISRIGDIGDERFNLSSVLVIREVIP